jgi:hypothetical protein
MAKLRFSKTKATELFSQCQIVGCNFVRLKKCHVPGYAVWMATGEGLALQLAGTPKKVEHCVIAIEVGDNIRPIITRRNTLLAKLIYCHVNGSEGHWQEWLEAAQKTGHGGGVTNDLETSLIFDSFMGTLTIRFSALPISKMGQQWVSPQNVRQSFAATLDSVAS